MDVVCRMFAKQTINQSKKDKMSTFTATKDEGRDSSWNCDYDHIALDAQLERDPS